MNYWRCRPWKCAGALGWGPSDRLRYVDAGCRQGVICGEDGIPIFNRLREGRQVKGEALLLAFRPDRARRRDLRREPIELRKAALAKLLRKAAISIQLNEHITEPGDVVFKHACRMGLEGIVSKRLGSLYRSGRSSDWLKTKNPAAPAVRREAEERLGQEAAAVAVMATSFINDPEH